MGNSWPLYFSWTKGYKTVTTNPDRTVEEMKLCSGPFFLSLFFIYAGARPTPPWSPSYGNEGLLARFLKKKGYGNLGFAVKSCR